MQLTERRVLVRAFCLILGSVMAFSGLHMSYGYICEPEGVGIMAWVKVVPQFLGAYLFVFIGAVGRVPGILSGMSGAGDKP